MVRISEASELGQTVDPERGRADLEAIWEELGPLGDPLHRCATAHALADLQEEVRDELAWDLRALEAAEGITDERAIEAGVGGSVLGFQPSLHLNIADAYRRLGEPWDAQDHLQLGLAAVDELGDDAYGTMIREGLDRLAAKLEAGDVGEG